MPPAAATVAGRRSDPHATAARAPRGPRRVSGPASRQESRTETRQRARPDVRPSGRATAAAAAFDARLEPAPVRTRREAPAPARPRREAPSRSRHQTAHRVRNAHAPRLALRLQAPRLDRIVRGRAWIPVLGALLVAIVGLRVEVLKLGASVGNDIQQATALQSSNAALRSQISALSDDQRIAKLAASYGMRMAGPLDTHFVQASAGDHVGAAIRNISAPSRQSFLTGLANEQRSAVDTIQAGSTLSTVGAAPSTTANSSSVVASTPSTSTSSSITTGATSTSTTGSGSTGGLSTSGATSTATGTASGNSATGGTPPASTAGSTSSTTGTGAGDVTSGGVVGTNLAPSTGQASGSASGGTGLAG